MNAHGVVIVNGVAYPNSWAEGKRYRLVRCKRCTDTGELLDDDGLLVDLCDCPTGEALRKRGWLA